MPAIRILPDQVANQIAAGEVVERPVAVLKELVENGIDAGAGKIIIEFRNGGKSYLRVEDDGIGMSQDQALLALERYATSKIRKASDLNNINSFGFRGEALPSIASVSRFVMRTRKRSSTEGTEIFVNGGKMVHCKQCGMPPGTLVEVSHLFNSVPGRRKFLKTEVTEASHLIHMSKLFALAHPSINFTLIENGRTIFRSPACQSIGERIREIFGRVLYESLAPLASERNGLSISGLVGRPGQSRSTRKEMIFFVNRRPVESKTFSYSVIEAFHTFIPKGRFPPAILFLDVDPSSIDINVHPSKREIRFRDEPLVRAFILESVLDHNRKMALGNESRQDASSASELEMPEIDSQALVLFGKSNEKHTVVYRSKDDPGNGPQSVEINQTDAVLSTALTTENKTFLRSTLDEKLVGTRRDPASGWRFLGFLHGSLGLFFTSEGVVAVHIRAAYERVRLEQLEDGLRGNIQSYSQSLLISEPLELDGIDRSNLEASMKSLKKVGFLIEEFGRNFYRLTGCPNWLEPGESVQYLRDFLEIARENSGVMQIESFLRQALERQVNFNRENKDEFSDHEIIQLVDRLLCCRNPYVCPKGRPTYFEIPKRDFETRFKRKL